MGLLFERRGISVDPRLRRYWQANEGLAGISVTPETAMNFSAVFAAHKILAESKAMLPMMLFERLQPRGKTPAKKHPLYPILHDVSNPEMDAYLVSEVLTGNLVGRGSSYAKIDYDNSGRITALWPIPTGRVTKRRNQQLQLVFDVAMPSGQTKTYRRDEIFWLRGFSPDGINTYTPIQLQAQGIGLALAAEGYGATFFGNGARPGGVLQSDAALSDTAYQRVKQSWKDTHGGVSKSNTVAILEEGLKWQDTSIPNEDAQFLQTRVFQVEEIARWYRIPNMMLNMSGANSTYASVEAYGLQFVIYTLYPWLVRWEKAVSMQLLLESEREKYFAEHIMAAILRGDTTSRFAAYGTGRQWGWLSVNDIRDLENMNPIDGGDVYLQPSNMVNANDPMKIQRSYLPVLADSIARVLRREGNDVRAAVARVLAKQGAESFVDWMGEFYREHQGWMVQQLTPTMRSLAEMIGDGMDLSAVDLRVGESLRLFALRHCNQAQERIKNALHESDPARAIEFELEKYTAQHAERLARGEMTRQAVVLTTPLEVSHE